MYKNTFAIALTSIILGGAVTLGFVTSATSQDNDMMKDGMMSPGLMMPQMNPVRGM